MLLRRFILARLKSTPRFSISPWRKDLCANCARYKRHHIAHGYFPHPTKDFNSKISLNIQHSQAQPQVFRRVTAKKALQLTTLLAGL